MPNPTVQASATALPGEGPEPRPSLKSSTISTILLLDEIDGDVEIEEDDPVEETGDAEPSLGATAAMNQARSWQATGAEIIDGREQDGREPDADFEPRFVPAFDAR